MLKKLLITSLMATASFSVVGKSETLTAADIKVLKDNAKAGNAKAQCLLGMSYVKGDVGLTQNFTEGKKWIIKSAEQGYADCQLLLGMIYGSHMMGKPDSKAAFHWLEKAAAQGNEAAKQELKKMFNYEYKKRESVKDYSFEELEEGYQLAVKEKDTKMQNIYALFLAEKYRLKFVEPLNEGKRMSMSEVNKYSELSCQWAAKAADLGDPDGLFYVATCLGEKDENYRALLENAASKGSERAKETLKKLKSDKKK